MDKNEIYQRATIVFPIPIEPDDIKHFTEYLARALESDVRIYPTSQVIYRGIPNSGATEGTLGFSFIGNISPTTPKSIEKYIPWADFESFENPAGGWGGKVNRFRFKIFEGYKDLFNMPSHQNAVRLWDDTRQIVAQYVPLRRQS